MVTGMIVFRILKVIVGVKPTSIERTLGSTGGNKFRHIMFIIIESAMALFAIQVVRVVLAIIPVPAGEVPILAPLEDFVIAVNQLITFIWLINRTNDNFGAGSNEVVFRRRRILQGICRKPSF